MKNLFTLANDIARLLQASMDGFNTIMVFREINILLFENTIGNWNRPAYMFAPMPLVAKNRYKEIAIASHNLSRAGLMVRPL